MLIGRQLQKTLNHKDKFVLTVPLLEGLDGRKMSKSFNNSVDIDDTPMDMFGKLMGVKDDLVVKYFDMVTDLTNQEQKDLKKSLSKSSPIELKKRLAWEVTRLYHGEEEANSAKDQFEKIVQKRLIPESIDEVKFSRGVLPKPYLYFLVETNLVSSSSEATRLAKQGGVEFEGKKITNIREPFETGRGEIVIRAGKRNFVRVKFV
jgi:tyrosyl-tRNA synthetase